MLAVLLTLAVLSVGPIRCAATATAADEDQCLAMLVRRPGENLTDLLQRHDAAIKDAYESQIRIDEVNALPSSKPSGRSRA